MPALWQLGYCFDFFQNAFYHHIILKIDKILFWLMSEGRTPLLTRTTRKIYMYVPMCSLGFKSLCAWVMKEIVNIGISGICMWSLCFLYVLSEKPCLGHCFSRKSQANWKNEMAECGGYYCWRTFQNLRCFLNIYFNRSILNLELDEAIWQSVFISDTKALHKNQEKGIPF